MRCKVGDLAVIVDSKRPTNVGRIVLVVSPSSNPKLDWLCRAQGGLLLGRGRYTREITPSDEVSFYDRQLRPIRDQPGEDESLQWKETPIQIIKELTQ